MASHQILSLIDPDGHPRRQSQRRRVMLLAKLVTSSTTYDVRIRDVSATGARIEGAVLPPQGGDVILKRGAFSAFGRLIWLNGSDGGVAFDEPLDEADLMETLKGMPERPATPLEPYRRPGFDREHEGRRWSDGRGWIDRLGPDGKA